MNALRTRLQKNGQEGFTLIELLIVIVVLGILAGIAIFAVSGFQSSATKACQGANSRINATVSAANSAGVGTAVAQNGSC